MKWTIFFACFLLINLKLFSQATTDDTEYDAMLQNLLSHTGHEITAKTVSQLDKTDVIFLDAREKDEYEISHIENAVWVGFNYFKPKRVKEMPKDKKIVVYCSVGYRSEKIAEKLLKMGFKDVSNLYGGIFDWANKGYELVDKGKKTEKVHAYDKEWGQWLKKGEKVY